MRTRSSAHAKEYEVDKIVDQKLDDKNNPLYRVRWKGYGAEQDSWLPLRDLKDAKEAVAEYERRILEKKENEIEDLDGNEENTRDGENETRGGRKAAKFTHFADNVEKLEQRIVGGDWQKVVENLKE